MAERRAGGRWQDEARGGRKQGSVGGRALEVREELVRLSVGIEDVEDLLAEVGQGVA